MSLYLIVGLFLLGGAIYEHFKKRTPLIFYFACMIVLTLMLCLRYGQGTDYLSYQKIYNAVSTNLIQSLTNKSLHSEFGWKTICWLFKLVKLPFGIFVAVISVVEMLCLYRFIDKFCKRKQLALCLSYHTLYLTYFFSVMRQGLVIALFIGVLLNLIIRKKYVLYVIFSLICASFHTVSLILLVVPLIHLPFMSKMKFQLIFIVLAWAVGFALASGIFDKFLPLILPQRVYMHFATRDEQISLLAAGERLISFGVIYFCYWYSRKKEEGECDLYSPLIRIAVIGIMLYGVFIWQPLIASRMSYVFKVVEIGVFCGMLLEHRVFSNLKFIYCLLLASVMFVKNVDSLIIQMVYIETVNVFNYPYISIFEKGLLNKYIVTK